MTRPASTPDQLQPPPTGPAPGSKTLPPIERLQAVQLEPGDIIVATVPAKITVGQVDAIERALVDEFHPHHVIVVAGVDISVKRSPLWRRLLRGGR